MKNKLTLLTLLLIGMLMTTSCENNPSDIYEPLQLSEATIANATTAELVKYNCDYPELVDIFTPNCFLYGLDNITSTFNGAAELIYNRKDNCSELFNYIKQHDNEEDAKSFNIWSPMALKVICSHESVLSNADENLKYEIVEYMYETSESMRKALESGEVEENQYYSLMDANIRLYLIHCILYPDADIKTMCENNDPAFGLRLNALINDGYYETFCAICEEWLEENK